MLRIALASCAELPSWECDDRPFHEALRAREIDAVEVAWDDPKVEWGSFDACLIRTTWDYQDKAEEFRAWVERVSSETKLINPAPLVLWNLHKSYLRELELEGARLAPTAWFRAGERIDIAEVLSKRGWQRAFLKPLVGANSRETLRFSSEEAPAAQRMLERLLPNEDLILQPYLSSVETTGEVSLIWFGGEFSHGVRKIPVPGDYRVQDDFGAKDEPYVPSHEFLKSCRAILERVEERNPDSEPMLYARVDFLFDEEGRPCLNEVEIIEPSLFFRHSEGAGERLADQLSRRLAT